MKRLFVWLGIAIALIGADRLSAGPEPIESKDFKAAPQPIVEPLCSWTGVYIGAHGGYLWGGQTFTELDETDPAYFFDQQGFFGGGQIGANLQLGSRFVIGIEGTFSGGDFNDSDTIFPGSEESRGHVDSDWIGTIGARVGMIFCKNRLLVFAKGGAAFTGFDYHTEEIAGDDETFDADGDRTAGLLGLGLEYAVTCHWSVKLEYNHLFFDSENITGTETSGSGPGVDRTFRSHVGDHDSIQAGLNFHF